MTGWTESDVVDVIGAELIVRTYTEQQSVRQYLNKISDKITLNSVCDIGAGYGRMSLVLREFCDQVVAFEREPELLETGSYLMPTVQYRQIGSLDELPAEDGEFDFALTFTVMQHIADDLVRAPLRELCRVVRHSGYVLLCEESDSTSAARREGNPHLSYRTRTLEQYKEWMQPFHLIDVSPRVVERGCPRANVGHFMLFRGPG